MGPSRYTAARWGSARRRTGWTTPTQFMCVRGCVGDPLLMRGGDTASEGRAAIEEALRVLQAPPHSLPDSHRWVVRLGGWLASSTA
mmetsp:Transcript_5682/g.13182  ORF Transcript_5682/g.13182 Transcript_5682/m.13182 type:complete len:86 (+) Transcript_5682:22-279(+)